MLFSVIYSVDSYDSLVDILDYAPPGISQVKEALATLNLRSTTPLDIAADKAAEWGRADLEEPLRAAALWQETERGVSVNEEFPEDSESHRKWCAILNREQFDEFVRHCGLLMEDVQTMGSLGAPGFGYGWAPALSFRNDCPAGDVDTSAYVTPVPEFEAKQERVQSRDWDRIRSAMLNIYS